MDVARPRLVAHFAGRGVTRADILAALPDPNVSVWLGTHSDVERDALAADGHLAGEVRAVVTPNGDDGFKVRAVVVQSQETVDREYAGSWFYAMR